MPDYKTHLIGGTTAYAFTVYAIGMLGRYTISPLASFEWLLFTLAGSLFPDVDIKSKGQKIFYRFLTILFVYLILQRQLNHLAPLSIIAMLPLIVNHRGVFHRLWFVVLAPLLVALFVWKTTPQYTAMVLFDVLFFIVGAVSHLWLDYGFKRMLRW